MKRSIVGFIVLMILGLLATPLPSEAQQAAAVVGWLNPQPLSSNRDRFAAFLKGLGEAVQ